MIVLKIVIIIRLGKPPRREEEGEKMNKTPAIHQALPHQSSAFALQIK
jgi:hypothetical protein